MQVRDNKGRVDFKEVSRGNDFILTLKYLQVRLIAEKIPSYWHHQCNLIEKLRGTQEIMNMRNWLDKAIKNLESAANTTSCDKVWRSYFGLDKAKR